MRIENLSGKCECGKSHNISVREIYIEKGAAERLKYMLAEGELSAYISPTVICDKNTAAAAEKFLSEIKEICAVVCLDPEGLHADNKNVETVEKELPDGCGLIIALGSGTIHDLSRYTACQRGIPFVSAPTAASVDGFVSTVAAMTWNGMKKTFPAVSPIYVFADTDIFSKAPYRLTASGISDLMGKYTALADWKAANLITGEHICGRIIALEEKAVNDVAESIADIRAGKSEAYEKLMYALILSGLAMQMMGNSRPASGAEHHISHLIEMEVINPYIDALHGEKVSVGLVLCLRKYHRLAESIRKGEITVKKYDSGILDTAVSVFDKKGLAEEILAENTPNPLLKVDTKRLHSKLNELSDIIEDLPSETEITELLKKGGCKISLEEIGLDSSYERELLDLSPFVRNRLTINRLSKLFVKNQP